MIITKARDNSLVSLTRELALWLMRRQRPNRSRGLIVYVDTQLKHSQRFNVEGLRHEHGELFEPIKASNQLDESHKCLAEANEGQLRFWTPEMCSKMPHLFDFVITVRQRT